jgi:hypothetical protein
VDQFTRNLAAFTEALGVENAGTVFHLSRAAWPDDKTRDDFITLLTGKPTEQP